MLWQSQKIEAYNIVYLSYKCKSQGIPFTPLLCYILLIFSARFLCSLSIVSHIFILRVLDFSCEIKWNTVSNFSYLDVTYDYFYQSAILIHTKTLHFKLLKFSYFHHWRYFFFILYDCLLSIFSRTLWCFCNLILFLLLRI